MATSELSSPRPAAALPVATLAALALIAGFAVASLSGSRPLGGAVMLAIAAIAVNGCRKRRGVPAALRLTATGALAFAASHVLGLLVGAWPAVLVCAAATALAARRLAGPPPLP